MKYLLIIVIFMGMISFNCQEITEKSKNSVKSSELHLKAMLNLITFFNEHAFNSKEKFYYSEIDTEGKVKSNKIYTVALSRLIYGLSYSSKYYPDNIEKAKNAADFLLNHLVGKDSVGGYFISYIENGNSDTSKDLDIWQQAYGLCGLTELYRNNSDKELLKKIHELHNAFILRFKDNKNGGLYGNFKIETGQITGSKTLQSLLYPITAYMANLWLADTLNRGMYEPIIRENLKIINQIAWNNQTNWVNLKFDDSWAVCKSQDVENPCFTVSPGHNFQLASLLLRTKAWDFILDSEKSSYYKSGKEILDATLKKPIFADKNLSHGFFSQVNPFTNKILDYRKTWWQHCEALIALSLCEGQYASELKQLEHFYFNTFPDFKNKGEFFYVDKDNKPITSELKGSIGKSAYHTIEMIRFLDEYKSKN